MGFIVPRGAEIMEEETVARSISDVFQSLAAGGVENSGSFRLGH